MKTSCTVSAKPRRHAAAARAAASALLLAALLAASALLSCSLLKKDGEPHGPDARIVIGGVTLMRDGDSSALTASQRLKPRDSLVVDSASKVKIAFGQSAIFANEGSSFKTLPPLDADTLAVLVHAGEYYLSAHGGEGVVCRFGDMVILLNEADAAFAISESGRLAVLFVLDGRARIKRGREAQAHISSCQAVVLDASGISEDEAATAGRAGAIERLKSWVGETAIERAAAQGPCKPSSEPAPEPQDTAPAPAPAPEKPEKAKKPAKAEKIATAEKPPKQAAPTRLPKAFAPADTAKPPAKVVTGAVSIEHVVGPREIYAEDDFTVKLSVTGSVDAITGYVWRFKSESEEFEKKTAVPQVTAKFGKVGESVISCEVMGAGGLLAAQQIKAKIVRGQAAISAGGPYAALLNKPIKLLGNAKSRTSQIAQYEWYFTHKGKPDFAFPDNIIVQHSFTKSGENKAVFAARLVDGTVLSDTAIVNVRSLRPTANAGADIVSLPNRKIKLKGTGTSPDGKIVKYEWDFDGDGVFDHSSETTGNVEHLFKEYATPILRVTDTEGNTDLDTMRVVMCPGDMATVAKGAYCIDKYEWPNQRGALPIAAVNWHTALSACEGAGKRLCTADEWKRACRNGSDVKPVDGLSYPYGSEFIDSKCNTLGNPQSKNEIMTSGSFNECVGALGVFDMSGNAAEWTDSRGANAQAFGGFYQSSEEASGCESSVTLDKDKKYLHTGFRCCK